MVTGDEERVTGKSVKSRESSERGEGETAVTGDEKERRAS
jgi:hypothetical protein